MGKPEIDHQEEKTPPVERNRSVDRRSFNYGVIIAGIALIAGIKIKDCIDENKEAEQEQARQLQIERDNVLQETKKKEEEQAQKEKPKKVKELERKLENAYVRLEIKDFGEKDSGYGSKCSGFVLDEQSIGTAHHCFENPEAGTEKITKVEKYEEKREKRTFFSFNTTYSVEDSTQTFQHYPKQDFTIVTFSKPFFQKPDSLKMNCKLQDGQEIYFAHTTLNGTFTVAKSSYVNFNGAPALKLPDNKGLKGRSGSPITDLNGNVCGVLSGTFKKDNDYLAFYPFQ